MEFHDFPFSWEWKNRPNWRTHIFQRGWYTTNQMLIWTWLVDVGGCLLYFTVLHFRDQHNEWQPAFTAKKSIVTACWSRNPALKHRLASICELWAPVKMTIHGCVSTYVIYVYIYIYNVSVWLVWGPPPLNNSGLLNNWFFFLRPPTLNIFLNWFQFTFNWNQFTFNWFQFTFK